MAEDRRRERRELLAATALFGKLDERELNALVDVTRLKRVKAREEVMHKGDEGTALYTIVKGRLKAMTTSSDHKSVAASIIVSPRPHAMSPIPPTSTS